MRPDPPLVIRSALKTLGEIAAGRTDAQEISRIQGVMSLLSMLESEWDTCASSRMDRILRYREIIRRGSSLLAGGERHHELEQALADAGVADRADADAGVADLKISSLDATLDTLRQAVGNLQAWLEGSDDPTGRALLLDLWRAEYADATAEDRNHPLW